MKGGKAPDNSAQIAELNRQKEESQKTADRLAQANLDAAAAQRRQKRGKSLLTATSEFGTSGGGLGT